MRPLEDQTVEKIPDSATFECEISKPGLKADWQRDGKPIKSGEKYTTSVDGGVYRLTLKDAVAEDEAEYTVVFKGAQSSAKLFVKGEEKSLL